MACRKNLKNLTANEKQRFVSALLALKSAGGYDKYVAIHSSAALAHNNPLFLPWHREFIRRFERDLQAIDPSVNLPYWDWTVDNLDPTGTVSLIWNDTFLGGPGDASWNVTTGPLAVWGLRRRPFNIFTSPGTGGLILSALADTSYLDFYADLESPHGSAHVWVGGDMGSISTAVRDPAFFLLHCNVDRLWSEWIKQHQADPGFATFLPASLVNSSMWPWNGTSPPTPPWNTAPEIVRPADLLDHRAHGYYYDTIDPECRGIVVTPKLLRDAVKLRMKETIKERIKDVKEIKETVKEGKELIKEIPDKTIKEKDKDKDLVEGFEQPFDPVIRPEIAGPFAGPEISEPRALGQPFIRGEERPAVDATGLVVQPELDVTATGPETDEHAHEGPHDHH